MLAEAYLQSMHLWTGWESSILAVWMTCLALAKWHQLSYISSEQKGKQTMPPFV